MKPDLLKILENLNIEVFAYSRIDDNPIIIVKDDIILEKLRKYFILSYIRQIEDHTKVIPSIGRTKYKTTYTIKIDDFTDKYLISVERKEKLNKINESKNII